jgi:hypothetical protein
MHTNVHMCTNFTHTNMSTLTDLIHSWNICAKKLREMKKKMYSKQYLARHILSTGLYQLTIFSNSQLKSCFD